MSNPWDWTDELGPEKIVYLHDGSNVTLRGKATVLDCVDSCGQLGTVKFIIQGDGQGIWASGLIRHHNPGTSFAVDLENVHGAAGCDLRA